MIESNEKVVHNYVKLTNPVSFKTRFPKVDHHTRGKLLSHGTKHRKDNLSPVEYPNRVSKHATK